MKSHDISDEALVEQILTFKSEMVQSDQLTQELISRHSNDVYQYIYRKLGNPEDAKDAAADTLMNMLKRLHQFDPDKGSFTNWLRRIAHNTAIDFIRKRKRRRETSLSGFLQSANGPDRIELAADGTDLVHQITLAKRISMLKECFEVLSPNQRAAVEAFLAETSTAETSQKMNLSAGVVAIHRWRAYRRLKKCMEAKLGSEKNS